MSSKPPATGAFRAMMLKRGANIAGIFWNTGNAIQLLGGALTLSPRILISSGLNIASSSASMLFGHKDWGIIATSLFGITGTALFLGPDLLKGEPGVIGGFAIYCCAASIGACGAFLSKRFRESPNPFLRASLGRPRRVMGTIGFISRLPIIVTAFAHKDWTTLAPLIAWALGDLSVSLSGEENTAQTPPEQTPIRIWPSPSPDRPARCCAAIQNTAQDSRAHPL